MTETVKTRILFISDTHCAQPLQDPRGDGSLFAFPLPTADVAIHCGDLTYGGRMTEYHKALDLLKKIDAPVKLVIAGNHDYTLDREFALSHIDKFGAHRSWKPPGTRERAEAIVDEAEDIWFGQNGRARNEGVQMLKEGVYDIDLPNGASLKLYASPYTPEFMDFGFAYAHNEDRFNPPETSLSDAVNIATNPIPPYDSTSGPIDICVTHGPPYRILDETTRGEKVGCPHLLRAVSRARPLIHAFGHIHEGFGAQRVRWSSSNHVKEKVGAKPSIEDCKSAAFQPGEAGAMCGVGEVERVDVDLDGAKERHGVFIDAATSGGARGTETLFINASIMTVRYQPLNPAWVVDIDLNRRTTSTK